jgi:hypothetical protein
MSRLSDGGADAKGTATRILDAAGGNYDKAIEIAKGRQAAAARSRNNKGPVDPTSNLSKAIKLLENKFDERTHNYVTWDQGVLNRMKLLERNGESMTDLLASDPGIVGALMKGAGAVDGSPAQPEQQPAEESGFNRQFMLRKREARKRRGMEDVLRKNFRSGMAGGVI